MLEFAQFTRSLEILRWSTSKSIRTGIILNSAKGCASVAASGILSSPT